MNTLSKNLDVNIDNKSNNLLIDDQSAQTDMEEEFNIFQQLVKNLLTKTFNSEGEIHPSL